MLIINKGEALKRRGKVLKNLSLIDRLQKDEEIRQCSSIQRGLELAKAQEERTLRQVEDALRRCELPQKSYRVIVYRAEPGEETYKQERIIPKVMATSKEEAEAKARNDGWAGSEDREWYEIRWKFEAIEEND